jgi:hypothetical protein
MRHPLWKRSSLFEKGHPEWLSGELLEWILLQDGERVFRTILTLLLCPPDQGYPMDLGSMLPMGFSKEKVDRFSGDKTEADCAPQRSRPFI